MAQYKRAISKDDERAKVDYLRFLKESVLKLARMKGADVDLLVELRAQIDESTFSDLCQELEYPRIPAGKNDPLSILARLPLPIYLTTSYHDFLERSLVREGKNPRTQICFWSGETVDVAKEHETDHDFEPTVDRPLVYHLLGLERYPTSIAISEDDYLDFMARVILDTDTFDPVIPLYIRDALSSSSLLLVGFRLHDWDFRVLFRGVIRPRQAANRMRGLIIQLTPEQQYPLVDAQKAREYLGNVFRSDEFQRGMGRRPWFFREPVGRMAKETGVRWMPSSRKATLTLARDHFNGASETGSLGEKGKRARSSRWSCLSGWYCFTRSRGPEKAR